MKKSVTTSPNTHIPIIPHNIRNLLQKTTISPGAENGYAEFLKGKRVVIVGPAPSILNTEQRDIIDSYDVVVRLNKALPLPENLKADIGTRTDVLYNCLNPNPENGGAIDLNILRNNDIKWICCPYPPITPFKKDIDSFIGKIDKTVFKDKFRYIDTAYYMNVAKQMDTRPNTGIGTILDILKFDVAELYITGFSFFKGGYCKEYRNYNENQVLNRMKLTGAHNQDKQKRYMKHILLDNPKIKLDKVLGDILHQK